MDDVESTLIVLDTNLFLHYVQPDQIDWADLAGVERLVVKIPFGVVQELDDLKWRSRSDGVPERAKAAVRFLENVSGSPEAREGCRFEVDTAWPSAKFPKAIPPECRCTDAQ